jgi:hypothetical protein
MNKIDWPNHIIAFVSALLGILIAFQLEYYREEHKEDEELSKALIIVKKKVENNLQIYKTNTDNLGHWLAYYDSLQTLNSAIDIKVDFFPLTGISTSGWNSAISSGIINKMEHAKVFSLTKIYDLIDQDLGTSDREMTEDQFDDDFDDLAIIVSYFDRVHKVHKFKYEQIAPLYERVEWQ